MCSSLWINVGDDTQLFVFPKLDAIKILVEDVGNQPTDIPEMLDRMMRSHFQLGTFGSQEVAGR